MFYKKFYAEEDNRNLTIDLLKGVATLFVIIAHFRFNDDDWKKYFFPFWIDMAVPTFMIISGYLATLSFYKRSVNNVSDAYSIRLLVAKFLRLTIPYIIFYMASITVLPIIYKENAQILELTIKRPISFFMTGGFGPGSYYYPIMIQFIFLIPVLFFIIKKYRNLGLIICIFLNIIYEFLQVTYPVPYELYRLLIFRYIAVISFGIYFYFIQCVDKNKFELHTNTQGTNKLRLEFQIVLFIIGVTYIIFHSYFGFTTPLIPYWTRTHWIPCLFIVPVIYNLLRIKIKIKLLALIGRASFNIFLVQCFYYAYYAQKVYEKYDSTYVQLFFSIAVCLISGLIFYFVETCLSERVIKKVDNLLKTDKFELSKIDCILEKVFVYK